MTKKISRKPVKQLEKPRDPRRRREKNMNRLAEWQLFGHKRHCEPFIDMDMDKFATGAIWFSSD